MEVVVTFFSHFGAVKFCRSLKNEGLPCRLAPVPRQLSTSCGTCARFQWDGDLSRFCPDDAEQAFLHQNGTYELIWPL